MVQTVAMQRNLYRVLKNPGMQLKQDVESF